MNVHLSLLDVNIAKKLDLTLLISSFLTNSKFATDRVDQQPSLNVSCPQNVDS